MSSHLVLIGSPTLIWPSRFGVTTPRKRTTDKTEDGPTWHTVLILQASRLLTTGVPQLYTLAIMISTYSSCLHAPTAQDSPYSPPPHSPFELDFLSLPFQQNKQCRNSSSTDVEHRPEKGDENGYIKRPEDAFILFLCRCCKDGQQEEGASDSPIKKQYHADVSKAISQQWKGMSLEEMQYWELSVNL